VVRLRGRCRIGTGDLVCGQEPIFVAGGFSVKAWLKSLRGLVRATGWDVVRYNAQTNVNVRRQSYLERLGIDYVFDIGANVGAYALALREFGYHGEIISVEPTNDAFTILEAECRRDGNWTAKNLAVAGREGERTIFVSANSVSSSLMAQSARMQDSCPTGRYVKQETIRTTTLDRLVAEAGGHPRSLWAKLDVQGSAGEILRASRTGLSQLRGIEIELPLVEMYGGEELFAGLLGTLQGQGFELVTLEANTFDPRTGVVQEVNGTLIRPSELSGAMQKRECVAAV
jgi:FkbM family methyltransferase